MVWTLPLRQYLRYLCCDSIVCDLLVYNHRDFAEWHWCVCPESMMGTPATAWLCFPGHQHEMSITKFLPVSEDCVNVRRKDEGVPQIVPLWAEASIGEISGDVHECLPFDTHITRCIHSRHFSLGSNLLILFLQCHLLPPSNIAGFPVNFLAWGEIRKGSDSLQQLLAKHLAEKC